VTLSNAVQGGVTVAYTTDDGSATTADGDYVNNDGSLLFSGTAGEVKTITVLVNGDTKVEADEAFSVALGAISGLAPGVPGGAGTITTAGSPQSGTITNDDSATLTLSSVSATNLEGNSGTTAFTFDVTLSNAVQGGVTVAYTTDDGSATTADGDYVNNDGSLLFSGTAGEVKTITVLVNGDTKVEADEAFSVALGAISGLAPGVPGGAGTITTAGSPQSGTITTTTAPP